MAFVSLSLSVFFQVCGFWSMRGPISAFLLGSGRILYTGDCPTVLEILLPSTALRPQIWTLSSHFPHHHLLLTFSHRCGHCQGSSLLLGVHRPFSLWFSADWFGSLNRVCRPHSCLLASKLEVPFACLTHGFGCPSSLGVLPLSKTKHTVMPPPPACVIPVSS